MNMPFEVHVALRYLLAKRKQAFISVISSISTLGVTVGVMALIIALALMTGLQNELRDRILGSNPHIYVWNTKGLADYQGEVTRLRRVSHVVGAAPGILTQGLVSASRETAPVQIKGIDPALEQQVTDIKAAMQSGSLESVADGTILLGKDLAAKLGVGVGDDVTVFTPEGVLSPMGMMPSRRRLKVGGIFMLGCTSLIRPTRFVSLAVAERLSGKPEPDFIQLRVDDIYLAPQIAQAIPAALGSQYLAEDWGSVNKSLFYALNLEKVAVSLTIGLIVMVAALNIVASLVLLVMEKNRDIAILKTMGASARSVTAIFMIQGLVIGVIGTVVGAVGGYGLSYVLDRYKLIKVPVDVYQVSHVPFTVLPRDLAIVVIAAVVVCFVATIYPARQAAKLDPAQALRYE